ncbi:MAG: elongation factor P [Bacteriovoracales bacterium]|jgi:elongation factor P
MLDTTELKKGVKIQLEGKVYNVLKSDFTNPGKGSAFVKCRIKNLETGQVIERTFKSGVSTGCEAPDLLERQADYLYSDDTNHNFMDKQTFEPFFISREQVGEDKDFLLEGIPVRVLFWNNKPISIEFPTFITLRVKETDPGLKGDTASGGGKKAVMETGLQVTVPLFIKEGELLKIDTRTREYCERVKE